MTQQPQSCLTKTKSSGACRFEKILELCVIGRNVFQFILSSNDNNSDSNHSSRGGSYHNNVSSRPGGRQNTAPSHHSNSNGHLERVSKGGHSRAAMQTAPSAHSNKGHDSPTAQPSNRKGGRGSRAQNQSQQNQSQQSQSQNQSQSQSQNQAHQESNQRRCSDDSDYSSLVEAMDRDLDRPESPANPEVFQEQAAPAAQATQPKGTLTIACL